MLEPGGCVLKEEAAAHGDPTPEQTPGRIGCLWRGAPSFLAVTAAHGRPRLEKVCLVLSLFLTILLYFQLAIN